nr:hypothetical protein [Candidatus Sigynarchaeota archaeon]
MISAQSEDDTRYTSDSIIKLVVIGAGGTGKSSLIHRFVTGSYDDMIPPTMFSNVTCMKFIIDPFIQVFSIFELACRKCTHPDQIDRYAYGGDAYAIVVSLVDQESMNDVTRFNEIVKNACPDTTGILIGTMFDALDHPEAAIADIKVLSSKLGMPAILTSARTNFNVDIAMTTLALLAFNKAGIEIRRST